MDRIGNRYLVDQLILPIAGGWLYNGKDLSLQRDVFLYFTDCLGETYNHDYIRRIGEVSRFIDERFMHIMDVGSDDTRVFAVMSNCEGNPLLHVLKRHNLTMHAILSLIFELGKGLQDAIEETIVGFSVAAENIWHSGKQLKVINYWSEGEHNRRGARGLCYLLYQLCVRSESVPDSLEVYEKQLWLALHDLAAEHKEAVVAITRRVLRGEDSLTSFMLGFRDVLETYEHEGKHAAVVNPTTSERLVLDFDPLDEEEKVDGDTQPTSPRFVKSKWIFYGIALLSVAFLFGYFGGWIENEIKLESHLEHGPSVTAEAKTSPNIPQTTPQSTPSRTNIGEQDSHTEESEVKSVTNEEGVEIPKLVGLTKEEAEKRALSAGIHYRFFLEPSKQEKGIVFKQDPEPGTPATKGDRVTFWVSKGNKP